MDRVRIRKMLYIALFAALMAVSAWIAVPTPIPFTLQTFTLFLTLMLLGGASGTTMSVIYIALGLVGLPVFAGFGSGVGYLLGASGGFIFSFPIAATLYLLLEFAFGKGKKRKLIYAAISLVAIYVIGSLWFSLAYSDGKGLLATLAVCVLPYVIPDAVKLLMAYYVSDRLNDFFNRGK